MKEKEYHYLLEKSKVQIIEELGQEFNLYQSDIWSYLLGIGWFGRRKILMMEFKQNKVIKIKVKNVYSKRIPTGL